MYFKFGINGRKEKKAECPIFTEELARMHTGCLRELIFHLYCNNFFSLLSIDKKYLDIISYSSPGLQKGQTIFSIFLLCFPD